MLAGTNTFSFLMTDISGSPLAGLTSVDFDYTGQVGDTLLTDATITESLSANGYYFVSLSLPSGQGFLEVKPILETNLISPTFYEIDTTQVYGTDDIYSSIARQTLDATQVSLTNYEVQAIGPYKQGDDWEIEYLIPNAVVADISGYSSFKASLWDDSILTSVSGSAGYVGDFDITVDVANKIVNMHMPNALTVDLVDEGSSQETFYSDLQAVAPVTGYKKTLAQFSILVTRQFTR